MDYENRSSEIIERVLLALGIFMGAVIVGYNAFFVPGMNFSTIIETSADVEDSEVSKDDIAESNVYNDDSINDEKIETENNVKEGSKVNKSDINYSENENIKIDNQSAKKKNNNTVSSMSKVNINTATASELAKNLKGVGEAIAKRIIDYRNKNGGFSSIDEIKKVNGIGNKIFENIKNNIYV